LKKIIKGKYDRSYGTSIMSWKGAIRSGLFQVYLLRNIIKIFAGLLIK
jgi:hypothetical protein